MSSGVLAGARLALLLPPRGGRGLLVATASAILDLTPRTVQRHLAVLERAGLAVRVRRSAETAEPDRWWRA